MRNNMNELLKRLICARSSQRDGEFEVAGVISDEFDSMGVESVVDVWEEKRANVTGWIRSKGDHPALLIGCHLDVVPPGQAEWEIEPFDGVESDGKIFGRGAVDMKGGIAAAMEAMRRVVKSGEDLKGDVIFAGTAGEETDSCGAKRFVENFSCPDEGIAGVLIPEPTNFQIVSEHRGLFWPRIITYGKPAHGSTPQLGVNAISSMRKVMDRLDEIELKDGCTISLNTISGGEATNVVPDECVLNVDIRTLAGQEHDEIIRQIKGIFSELENEDENFRARLEVERNVGPLKTDESLEFVKKLKQAADIDETISVGYCTDAPFFERLGASVLIFGPGDNLLCHKPDEYIESADLERGAAVFERIIRAFCC